MQNTSVHAAIELLQKRKISAHPKNSKIKAFLFLFLAHFLISVALQATNNSDLSFKRNTDLFLSTY